MKQVVTGFFLVITQSLLAQVYVNTAVVLNQNLVVQSNGDLILADQQDFIVSGELDLNGSADVSGSMHLEGALSISGDLNFSASTSSFSPESEVFLDGENQIVLGNDSVLGALHVNEQGVKTLESNIFANRLFLNNGRIHTSAFRLDISGVPPGSLVFENGWVSSNVNGQLSAFMNATEAFIFPVGDLQSAYHATVTPLQAMNAGVRYAGNSASDDGLSLFQVASDVCRLRDDVYIRLYNLPAESATVQFRLPPAGQGGFNRIAARRSLPFQTWNVFSEGNPVAGQDFIEYTVLPPVDDASLVPARIRPNPPLLSGPQEICILDPDVVYTANGNADAEFTWNVDGGIREVLNDSQITVLWNALPEGLISVVSTDQEACSSISTDFLVTVFPLPQAELNIQPPLISFEDEPFTFSSISLGADSLHFWFSDGSAFFESPFQKSFNTPGIYDVFLEAISAEGCKDTVAANVTVEEGLILSNVFTPNGDGFNDVWEIPESGLLKFNLQIMNRWGAVVFESSNSKVSWDGRDASSELVTPGTYYFILRAESATENYSTRGTLQVIY